MIFFELEKQANKKIEELRAFELTPNAKDAAAPIDEFELILSDKEFELASDAEIETNVGSKVTFDVECYENYFLIGIKFIAIGKYCIYEIFDNERLNKYDEVHKIYWILNNYCVIGFNSKDYDIPLVRLALQGNSTKFLKSVSNWIIFEEKRSYEIEKKYNLKEHEFNHIDLIEVAPLKGSLKLYAGRLHCKRMQDLPYEHTKILTYEETQFVKKYNFNDLDNTELLANELEPHLQLRKEMSFVYNQDLRSRSDAQVAEYVIASELERINGYRPKRPEIAPGKSYIYVAPRWLVFKSPLLNRALEVVKSSPFIVGEDGAIAMPEEIGKLELNINKSTYRMGIGGLHSSEKSIAHIADENTIIADADVVSYYPSIILNESLYPKHLGRAFLNVYRTLVTKRLQAKKEGNKIIADSLKITINGCFGKLGNKWSVLYAPYLLIQVTLTGQLALLMLIEMLEYAEITVISANTDGVLIKCDKSDESKMKSVIRKWEHITGFETEESLYRAFYSRDVNNYIGVKKDGTSKVKGAFSDKGSAGNSSLSRNAENFICNDAVLAFITNKTPISDTINLCRDMRKFVTVRNVKGGAIKSGVYLGKCIRWYYSTNMQGEINYKIPNKQGNYNKVPNSDKAMPLMELPEALPDDIDYDRYISIAKDILIDIGVS